MDNNFKIGDKVMIKEGSRFFCSNDECNPINVIGTVIYVSPKYNNDDLNISVEWDIRYVSDGSIITNCYHSKDLVYTDMRKVFGKLDNFKFK
jgi:hypothetical protein